MRTARQTCRPPLLLGALLLLLPDAAVDTAPDPVCSVKATVLRQFEAPAAAAGVRHLTGLDTCRRADGGGALVTVHFQLGENAELQAELHEQLPPQNDPAGALGAPGACADVVAQHGCSGGTLPAAVRERIRGSSLAELCPASCAVQGNSNAATDAETAAELLRSPLTQPALGCTRKSAAACPRAVVVSLPTGGPVRSYLLRVYAAPSAAAGAELPMAVELSLAVAPVPWGAPSHTEDRDTNQAAAVSLPRRSALLPIPFSGFAVHRAVLTSPLRRHLRIGARYNFEVALGGDAQAVALVPTQAEQGILQNSRRLRWVYLAPAEDVSPKAGIVRWRGSSVIRAGGGLMLMAQFGTGNYDALVQFEATDDHLLVNGSTGVTGDQAWKTAVRIIRAPGSTREGDLGLQPLSHPYSEVFLDGLHMTMTLVTKRAARLRVQISSEQQQIVRVDPNTDKEDQSCKASEVAKDSRDAIGAVWEQPRVLITHNGAYTEHTIYVHWDHPDAKLPSDNENDSAAGRVLQIYAADLVTADLNQGWPLVLEYSVRVAPIRPGIALDTRTLLRGLASALGGWLSGSNVGSGGPSFVPLKQESSGDQHAVHRHLQNLPGNATDSIESLALGLCIWDEPAWNYRSIFSWVTKNIEYDEALLKVLEADPTARRTIRPMEPQEVLAQRRTVCSGYAALTVALCQLCEIPAYSVRGHAKSNARIGTTSAQRLGHAWVAVHLDGRWTLSDPTWASAAIDDESIAQHERWDVSDEFAAAGTDAANMVANSVVDDYYYLPSAAELLPTHLPEDPQWQLLDRSKPPIDRDQWDNLPKVKPSFWKAGLSPLTISRDTDGTSEAAATAMEQAESAWELCEASAGGQDGWRSLMFNFGQGAPVHCTSVHRAGRRLYPSVASAFTGTSGEWEVVRFGLRVGAPKQIDLLTKVWAVPAATSLDTEEAEEQYLNNQHRQQEEESGWMSLASVRREHDEFSVYVVLPTPGIYVLRVYVALGASETDAGPVADQIGNDMLAASSPSVNQGLQYAHAVDFLLDASAPSAHWVDCIGCLYPRLFGAAGAVTLHAPRQRLLRTGHDFNLVLELPSYAREQTLVVRDAGTGREVQLHRTTIGTLLGVPKFVRVAYAGSFRCAKEGVVTVFTRWRGERQMRAVMEFECRSDGHAPVPGTGGVMPPSNIIDDATTSIRCERLACLPLLPNVAFIQDAGASLGFALVSHTAAAWSVTTAEIEQVVFSTTVPSTVSAQLKEAGVSDAAEDPDVYTLVSSSDGGRRHTVEFCCRRPWRYELLVFAGLRATLMDPAPHALPLMVQYTVDAIPAASDHERASSASGVKQQAQQFPRVFAEFSSCGCELLQPRTRKLSAGPQVKVNFSLILGIECEATAVAVIQSGRGESAPQWTHLRREADNAEESAATASSDTRGVGSDSERNPRDAAVAETRPVRWTGTVDLLRAGELHVAAQLVAVAPEKTQRQQLQRNSAQYRHLVEYTVEI